LTKKGPSGVNINMSNDEKESPLTPPWPPLVLGFLQVLLPDPGLGRGDDGAYVSGG
jgi:hypothetical protein